MNTLDKIDIILVTYKRFDFLKETVKKIYERTRYPYRLLVVNNDKGNVEVSRWLAQKKAEGFVHDFIELDNPGLAAAYTAGFNHLGDKCGEYFITTQDDLIPPMLRPTCWLERLLELFKRHEYEYCGISCRIQRVRRREIDEEKDLIDSPTSLASIYRIQKRDEIAAVGGFGAREHWESVGFIDRMQVHKKKFAIATHIYCDDIGFAPPNKGFEEGFINYKSYSPERVNQGELQPYPDVDPETNIPIKINTTRDFDEHRKRLDIWKKYGFKKSAVMLELLRLRHGERKCDFCQMREFTHLLYTLARDNDNVGTIVEIGTANGVSTNSFLYGLYDRHKSPKQRKLYSIDINDCREWADIDMDTKHLWEFIQADSTKMVWNRGLIDILLIDGNHSYDAVRADYNNFSPAVRKGGLILLHDVCWPDKGVKRFYEEDLKSPGTILPLGPSGMAMMIKI